LLGSAVLASPSNDPPAGQTAGPRPRCAMRLRATSVSRARWASWRCSRRLSCRHSHRIARASGSSTWHRSYTS